MANTYDPVNHIYRIDGVRVPSVTQVLTDAGVIDDRWFTDESRERGRIVAAATALYDQGKLDMGRVPEHCQPYVQAWIDWRVAVGITNDDFIEIETPRWNTTFRYGGKSDAIAWIYGRRTVVEKKTGSVARWHKWQTAGYRDMLSPMEEYRRMAVYLNPGKPAKVAWHEGQRDMDAWRMFVGDYHLKREGKPNA